jgi:hypothetical protein
MTAATVNGHAPIGADVLSREESIALSDCEQRIERGMKTFIEVGMALAAIQQNRLYRAQFDTFEEYCADRWGFTGRRGRQLIEAAEIGTMVPIDSERQARALAAAPAAEREDVLREARERTGGKPTAKAISEVVKERSAPPPEPEPESDLTPEILRVLADAAPDGRTAWQVAFLIDAANPPVERVTELLGELADVGKVDPFGRTRIGNRMEPQWVLAEPEPTPETPEPTADPSAAQVGSGPTPGPTGAVVDPPVGSGSTSPEPEPERHLSVVRDQPRPASEEGADLAADLARDSVRRTAVASIRSVLTYLTSRVLEPAAVAEQYVVALDEFTAADLRFAAETLAALAALKERQ